MGLLNRAMRVIARQATARLAPRQAPTGFPPGTAPSRTGGVGPVPGDRPVVEHAAEVDGEPDPGEVVWAWVPYEDDPQQGKDRPVLLLAFHQGRWLGLMLSSQDHDRDAADEARWGRYWMDVGAGGWDRERRPSEVRLDRLLRLDDSAIRREGAALDPVVFDQVVAAAREHHDLG